MVEKNNLPLLYTHIGDLHLTDARQQNYKDFLSIIVDIETGCADKIDFVYLPGDNADHGELKTYKLISTALKMLSAPAYLNTGDHDMEQGNLDNFYTIRAARQMPFSISIKNLRCLFIDVCGNGKGGPDFRIGKQQMEWMLSEAELAKQHNEKIVLFMHTFPDDLKDADEKKHLNKFVESNNVLLVDMGHTHYNEIANDGNTIFSATRSTGQIEEGPVGYSLASIDNNVVSWRFKLLDEPFPFVMITYPADKHLTTIQTQRMDNIQQVRAVVLSSKKIKKVQCKIDDGEWIPMTASNHKNLYSASITINNSGKPVAITVEAIDETGRPGIHSIVYSPEKINRKKLLAGSDEYKIGAWTENHIFGTQLGPNRNAKPD